MWTNNHHPSPMKLVIHHNMVRLEHSTWWLKHQGNIYTVGRYFHCYVIKTMGILFTHLFIYRHLVHSDYFNSFSEVSIAVWKPDCSYYSKWKSCNWVLLHLGVKQYSKWWVTSPSNVEANFPDQDVVCLWHLANINLGSWFATILFPILIQPVNSITHYGS